MAHSEVVVGPNGWNGWAAHVSEHNFPLGTQFRPLSARFPRNSPEMQSYLAVYPLDSPAKITDYWSNLVRHVPQSDRGSYNTWLTEAAIETVRRADYPDLPSRLESIFAFRCGAEAIRFACHFRTGQMAYIYEFQPPNGTVMVDMKIWDAGKWDYTQPAATFEMFVAMGYAYWQSATNDLTARGLARPELLVPPPVTVIEPAIRFERER